MTDLANPYDREETIKGKAEALEFLRAFTEIIIGAIGEDDRVFTTWSVKNTIIESPPKDGWKRYAATGDKYAQITIAINWTDEKVREGFFRVLAGHDNG